ncbi:MAG TPA: 4Fe-4S binding protein [Candidatus Atribacteria bacterium]|nr:4Fe-4S binding protein [Candidatus Atribacteria bacterium]
MAKAKVNINQEFCKGCGLCVNICPKKILTIEDNFNSKGYYPATMIDEEKCTACGFCAQVCPDVAISVYRE